ncbi:MAG: cytochrome c oxidase subunit II [Gemmatimonadetes bacterium]|nr:cytochrome c oxidase subunit II [Gemmatimonadota bacterium]
MVPTRQTPARGSRRARFAQWFGAALGALFATGCAETQSALDPHGPAADAIARIGWIMFAGAAVVAGVVFYLLLRPVLHAWRRPQPAAVVVEEGSTRLIVWGSVLTTAVLIALFSGTMLTLASIAAPYAAGTLELEVIGHQWWWEVRYRHPDTGRTVTTANEIHIPVGRAVRVAVRSDDVNHSFWVPRLHGKIDMLPGRTNRIVLEAAEPGLYPGACSEFCGLQHANMRLLVIAEPPEEFTRWLDWQAGPALPPTDALTRQGQQVFIQAGCVFCHTFRTAPGPSPAPGGAIAPDLTHIGSRRTLGAGMIPNTPRHLQDWIADAPARKPGIRMPAMDLDGPSLQALAAYLEGLR